MPFGIGIWELLILLLVLLLVFGPKRLPEMGQPGGELELETRFLEEALEAVAELERGRGSPRADRAAPAPGIEDVGGLPEIEPSRRGRERLGEEVERA